MPPSHATLLEQSRLRAGRVGSSYGGWTFDSGLLSVDSVVYSAGIGKDTSWDDALIEKIGCMVHGFDDTPVSNKWMRGRIELGTLPARFHWHRWLLASKDGAIEIGLPHGFVSSFTTVVGAGPRVAQCGLDDHRLQITVLVDHRLQKQWLGTQARACSLASTMRQLNHTSLDLLKMDIEAGEFDLFDLFSAMLLEPSLASTPAVLRLPACQLLVEFHSRLHREGWAAKGDALLALQSLGFTLMHNVVRASGADDAFFMNPRFCRGGRAGRQLM